MGSCFGRPIVNAAAAAVRSMKPTASTFFAFLVLPRIFLGSNWTVRLNGSRVDVCSPLGFLFLLLRLELPPWARVYLHPEVLGDRELFWIEAAMLSIGFYGRK